MKLRIHCLFASCPGENVPELAAAWDEWRVCENPESFEEECRLTKASYPEDTKFRYIDLFVYGHDIRKTFDTPTVFAEVSSAKGDQS